METSQQAGDGRNPPFSKATSDPDPPGQYLIVKPDVKTLGIGIVIGLVLASLASRCGCDRSRC